MKTIPKKYVSIVVTSINYHHHASSFNKILHVHFDYNVIQIDALLRQALRRANVTVSSSIIRTGEDPTTIDDLFVSAHTVINLYML